MLPTNRPVLPAIISGLLLVTLCSLFLVQHTLMNERIALPARPSVAVQSGPPKIAKVSVIYGELNEYYEAAIKTHQRHADLHGYPFHILRNPVATGYWNKAAYLESLLVQELGKDSAERAEWLMWVDADSMIINPEIPVEIFLPPEDFEEVHFLANKDQNGLNTGIFFVRVHPWSIAMFTKALAYPMLRPEVDLGVSADQQAMALIFNETDNQSHVLYTPRKWFNTYQFHHGFEGTPGYLLVHFPGLEEDRWNQMGAWLRDLNDPNEATKWAVPVQDTHYLHEIREFWGTIRKAQQLVELASKALNDNIGDLALSQAIEDLKIALRLETDQPHLMQQAMEQIVLALES